MIHLTQDKTELHKMNFWDPAAVITRDSRYVIVLMKCDSDNGHSGIIIIDLRKKIIRKSKIKLPFKVSNDKQINVPLHAFLAFGDGNSVVVIN